mmetsp:Transcript_63068/g.173072  ORF Transcript_63068/g.173072 Transcript_63068/m.173072 type:complete len:105 (-) Transcript_63068:45-359(-)
MEPDPEKLGDGRTPTDAHQDLSQAVPHNPPPSSFDDSAQRQAMKASNIFAKTASDVGADAMPKFKGNSAQILLKVKVSGIEFWENRRSRTAASATRPPPILTTR